MAVQKNNTYYDYDNSELYYYDKNGVRKPLQVGKDYSAGSGIKIENDIISVSGKYVASADSTLSGKRLVLKDNKWIELILPSGSDWSQTIQEASAYAYNASTAWTNEQGYLTAHQIIPSARWENASDVVESNSSKWNDGYNTLSSNSGNWLSEDDIIDLATKEELNTASSTLNVIIDEYKDFVDDELAKKQDKSAMSAYALSSWVDEDYQKKGNYLSANALDLISDTSGKWNEVSSKLDENDFTAWSANYNEYVKSIENDVGNLKSNSSNWDSVYNNVNTNSAKWYAASDEVISHSANWTSASRALEASADKWNTTHEQVNISSVKWNELYDEYQVSSKLWNDTTNTVKTFSGDWNDVSSKADKLDIENLSGKVETLSGKLKTTSSFLSGSIDVVSAEFEKVIYTSATENWDVTPYSAGQNINITNHTISGKDWTDTIEEASANAVTTIENNFKGDKNGNITAYGTSSFANDKYTAGEGLALNDHQFYVSGKYITSAGDSLSGKMLVLKDNKWLEMPEFGGFATANSGKSHPDVQNPSTKLIYLVKDSNVTGTDKYSEWIYTSDEQTTAWECIGDTSLDLDLTPYLTKEEAIATYQPKGDYVTSSTSTISANETYGLTNDGNTIKWVKLVNNDTTYAAGKNIVISGIDNEISVSGLYNTTLTSTDDSVGISATTDSNGNIQYDLGVTIPGISGISGVSAYYDENKDQYIVGLEKNDIGFAKYSTSSNIFTTSAIVNGYNEDLNLNPTKIALTNDEILLKIGLYHVDVQTYFKIENPDNNYYYESNPTAATITQIIDASFAHTETIDLSFDVRITSNDTPLKIIVSNFKTNESFAITNLNIHEIVSMPSQIEGGSGNYEAGNGIAITNDTIEAKLGNGLEFNESKAIQVKLGSGLKFDEAQGVQAITIDNNVGEVVESVNKLQEDLDTKITDNYPPAMITLTDLQVAEGTQYAPGNGGMLIGYLFTCPITHKIYSNTNNDYLTKIGIYTKQWAGDNKKVILGIYEYDPDYINPETKQVGTTRALCDTGIIDLQQGYAEYDIKNLGNDTTHEMTPGKFYYASIYLSYLAGDTYGITLFGAPGYNTQVNALKPGITVTNINKIKASLYEGSNGYSPNLNFDQMGFSWQFGSYPPDETTSYTSQDIVEAYAAGRPYFAIRNIKVGN